MMVRIEYDIYQLATESSQHLPLHFQFYDSKEKKFFLLYKLKGNIMERQLQGTTLTHHCEVGVVLKGKGFRTTRIRRRGLIVFMHEVPTS